MRFEPSVLMIDDDHPWGASAFDLSETGNRLTNLVKNAEGPAVISLTAPWGTGKTSFLNMWRASLRLQNAKVVKFSAWEVDYTHDALVALIQELSRQLRANNSDSPSIDQIKEKGSALLRHVAPFAVKAATGGIIDIQGIDELSEKLVAKKLADHERAKVSAEKFRGSLRDYAQMLEAQENEFPLVIIVDELDRCRPSYAVELLESIKHFFNVSGVVFVIGVDIEQLGETIKGHYGQGYDGHRYLTKFFHLQLKLPEPDLTAFCQNTINRLGMEKLFEGPGLHNTARNAFSKDFIACLAEAYGLSLRDIERLILESSIIYTANTNFSPIFSRPILWMLVQKQCNPSLFDALISQQITAEEAWAEVSGHTHAIFYGDERAEAHFRVVLTLLIEGRRGLLELNHQAKELAEAHGAHKTELDYWYTIQSTSGDLYDRPQSDNAMAIVKSTVSLLGFRESAHLPPYGH